MCCIFPLFKVTSLATRHEGKKCVLRFSALFFPLSQFLPIFRPVFSFYYLHIIPRRHQIDIPTRPAYVGLIHRERKSGTPSLFFKKRPQNWEGLHSLGSIIALGVPYYWVPLLLRCFLCVMHPEVMTNSFSFFVLYIRKCVFSRVTPLLFERMFEEGK